jgi:hypothetical protein
MTETEQSILDVLEIEAERIAVEQEKIQEELSYIEELENQVIDQQEKIIFLEELVRKNEEEYLSRPEKRVPYVVYKDNTLTREDTKIIQSVVRKPYQFAIALLSTLIIILGVLLWNSHFNDRYEVIVFAQAIQGCTQDLEEKTEEIKNTTKTVEYIIEGQNKSLDRIHYLENYYQLKQ